VSGVSFPLDSMYGRGDSCLNVVWTPDSANTNPAWYVRNGSLCTGADTVYRHCDFTAGVTYRSIAYSYGGEDNYQQFRDKLGSGLLAGSHLCHYQTVGDPSPYVAGTDCSGFVCYLWNVARTSTNGLLADTRYQHIQKTALRAGDIMVRAGSHAVFVVDQDDSTSYVIWESTSAVNGCRERITDISLAAWDPYVALRNPATTRSDSDFETGPAAGRGNAVRITPVRNGSRLDLRFGRRFNGEIRLLGPTGKLIRGPQAVPGTGLFVWNLPAPLAPGTYIIALHPSSGGPGWGRFTIVR
jgi:hypothetical protein